jgi:alpha-glucosidase (family GH31 glycosyl hydrolase)
MKISLRKAHAVQTAIKEAMVQIEPVTTISVNQYQDYSIEMQKAQNEFCEKENTREELLRALYSIRGKVGKAKELAGIGEKLTQCAYIDKQISMLESFANCKPETDQKVVYGRMDTIKNTPVENRAYGFVDSVSTTIFSREQIEEYKKKIKSLKKQKQKLNDEVLELNIKTEVELDPETVKVLSADGIL